MKNKLTTTAGKLNNNWRKILVSDDALMSHVMSMTSDRYELSTRVKLFVNDLFEMPRCTICGKDVKTISNTYCSQKCAANDPLVTAKKIASTDTYTKSVNISTALKGRSNLGFKSWSTRKDRYGKTGMTEESKSKSWSCDTNKTRILNMQTSCMIKYGTDNFAKTEEFREWASNNQIKSPNSRIHLAPWVYDKDQFIYYFNNHGKQWVIDNGNMCDDLFYRLTIHYGIRSPARTIAEVEICTYIESLGYTVTSNNRRIIAPKELDIYVPSANLAIEFNGIYWHSSGDISTDYIKNNHVDKTDACESIGISLLHISEHEWNDDVLRDIWKSVISHKLNRNKRVYARKLLKRLIPNKIAHEFCKEHHLQGSTGCDYAYGLYYNDELLMVATFGKSRFEDNTTELIRMCTKKYIAVVGGASKLCKDVAFTTYANRRWSSGNVYNVMGMRQVSITLPNYFYVDLSTNQVHSRHKFMKHKLKSLLNNFDDNKTEVENCYINGYRRMWDCGNIKFVKS